MIWRSAAGSEPGSNAEGITQLALESVPGVGLRNYTVISGRSVREIDCILVTPQGLRVVETKGSSMRGYLTPSLNGAWLVDGVEVDFKPSPNPLPQVRKSSQMLRSMLADYRCDVGFIVGVISVVGEALHCPSVRVGDVVVAPSGAVGEALEELDGCLSTHDAMRVLTALDVRDITEEELAAEGFAAAASQVEEQGNARERRALRKRAELSEQGERVWRSSNRRRLAASGFGSILAVMYILFANNLVAASMAVIVMLIAMIVDLFRRAHLEGERDKGPLAAALWVLTVGPFAGVGAVLGLVAVTSFEYSVEAFLALQIGLLLSLALVVTTLTGKSSFIWPPPAVVERTDALGRPLGTFYLADASPKRGWWYKRVDGPEETSGALDATH